MSKETGVIAMGIWVFVLPFLGIPGSWKEGLFILTGLGLAALGFFLRSEAMSRGENSPSAPFKDGGHENHEASVGEEVR